MTLHDRLWLPRRAAGEEPDRGVVAVAGERLELRRCTGEGARGPRLPDHDDLFETCRAALGRLKYGRGVAMHERHRRPRVRVDVLDRIHGELWVDHHHYRANFECAEQRRYELRPVGQRDDDPLLGLHAGAVEQMTEPVRERLHLTVRERALVREQRRPISLSLADARVQQPIGDV